MESTFTICFEPPFWVGILERSDEDGYWIGRHVFGGEPTNAEIWEFAQGEFCSIRLSLVDPEAPEKERSRKTRNIKKSQREARRDQKRGLSPYTHDALQKQYQLGKEDRRDEAKSRRERAEALEFAKRQKKKKDKLRGH